MRPTPATSTLLLVVASVFMAGASEAQDATGQPVPPPTVEKFEEPVGSAPGQTNPSSFRFTYPVRDASSNRVYTEENPPATADLTPESGNAEPVPQQAESGKPGRTADSTDAPITPSEGLELAEEQVIGDENLPQVTTPDIGEGRFGRRPFRYSFAVYEGYNSNVNGSSTDQVESMYTSVAAGVDYGFGTSRLDLGVSLDAAFAFYYNNNQLQNDGIFPTITLGLNAGYKATPKLDLLFVNSTALLSQPNFATSGGGPSNYQGVYLTSATTLSAEYRWMPKFSTVTSYSPLLYYYIEPEGDNFSYFDQTAAEQFVFLWKPLTQLVAEYRFNLRNYFELTDYNSLGNYALLGFNYRPNKRSTVTLRAGAEQRVSQNPVTGGTYNYIGPFGELSFAYAFGDRTSVALTSRYGTTGTGMNNYSQTQQFLLGLTASHRLGRRITLGGFANFQNNYYAQPNGDVDGVDLTPSYSYNIFNAGVSAGYYLRPDRWSLQAGYSFTTLVSGNTDMQGNYTQNVLFLGSQLDF